FIGGVGELQRVARDQRAPTASHDLDSRGELGIQRLLRALLIAVGDLARAGLAVRAVAEAPQVAARLAARVRARAGGPARLEHSSSELERAPAVRQDAVAEEC